MLLKSNGCCCRRLLLSSRRVYVGILFYCLACGFAFELTLFHWLCVNGAAGGEYETVTLDCPLFTRGSIAVSDWMQVCHSDDAVAPVWLQSPVEWKVVPKDPTSSRRRARSHAVLHDLEWLRVKPFLDLIDVAVKEWGVEAQNGDSSAPSPLCQTGPDLGSAPPSVGSPSECCEWTWHFPAWSLGYILTGDICVTRSEEGGEAKGGNLSPPNTYWIPLVTERMSTWLDEQLRKTHRSGVRSRIIGAICQACCPDFIGIPENVFEHLGIKPVSLTVVVAPLPRGVKLRLKFVLSSPEGVAVPPTLSLKSLSDDSVVHVHSLNLWVPPCAELDAVHRQGTCCSCQGMRCELASESSFSVSYLLLRGCDGRLPFTCDFPDEVREPNRIPSIWTIEEYRESKPAFYTALQTVNAFISMQYTRHLCYTGGSHRGFPHDDCERFIDEAELGRADSTISQSTHSTAPRALHVTSLLFMAPCIVVFVKLKEGNEEAKTKSDRKLAAVKRLLHLLISRSSHGDEGSLSGDDTESQTILIVAEAPSLPGKARVLMLPMFDISPRQRDRGCSQARAAQHVRQQEEKYTVAVTVVERRLKVRRDPGATVTRGGLHRIRSMAVRLSLQEQLNYTGRYTWEDLVGQLCSTLTHWLKEQSLREGIAILSSDDAEEDSEVATTVGGTKRMLEVCVFYCTSYVHSLQTDSESFEANCRQRIEAGCCESAVASSEFLPIITFFPVLNLAGGVLELVGHTLSAYPK